MLGDNPASRLLDILRKGKEFSGSQKCRFVWYRLLDVEDGDDSLLMSRLGKVMELPEQIIQKIDKEFPDQSETYLHWSARVNKAFFQQNLNGEWKVFNDLIDPHTLNYLSLSANLIQVKSPSSPLDTATIEDLSARIQELQESLLEGDFDDEFREYLYRALMKINVAIQEYRISGALPVMDAVESAFGHAIMDGKFREQLQTDFGRRVVSVLSAVASSVTIALGLPQLPPVAQLLIGGIAD